MKVYHITEMLVRSVCPDADREHIEKALAKGEGR
jgi:hypothetical protein